MPLTNEELRFFGEEGYLLIDRFLADDQVEHLRLAYMETLQRLSSAGSLRNAAAVDDSDDYEKVYQLRTAHLLHDAFDAHVRNPVFLDIIEQLIGTDIQLVHYQGLYKPARSGGQVGWHQDDTYWPSNNALVGSVSLWVPLDDATVDNGCMWYVPRSQDRLLPHEKLWNPQERKGFYYGIPELPGDMEHRAVPATVRAGGIAIHSGALVHGSRPNHSERPRRALASHFINPRLREVGGVFKDTAPEAIPVLRSFGA